MKIVKRKNSVEVLEHGNPVMRVRAGKYHKPYVIVRYGGSANIADSNAQLERLGLAIAELAMRNMEVSK